MRNQVEFAPLERVAAKPNLALAGGAQFMDLAGDGQPDLVVLDGPVAGFYEHDDAEGWQSFRPFTSRLNHDMRDPNLKFIDLDGDGHADVLITEDNAFIWHASLAEEGFGPAVRVAQALDDEKGPRLVFADGTQSIYLADLSGDGLTDLVRIRNGEVCYWPSLGYCKFGAKVTMDHSPQFDNPDQFDHKRIRLADIDGSGTTDIIYLHRDGVRLYFNQSGNTWSAPQTLTVSPQVNDLVNIIPTDLLGNGTACLVWSSPLPGDANRPMRYVNLMGDQKPHLLFRTINNLGAETRVDYAPSTKFYLQDKRDGTPWITRLPFPVHVVERVETRDHISGNRFTTRYAYHHGYFDGEEREFRGFGMVEQWDTEEFSASSADDTQTGATNEDKAYRVPPVHTKTWFHTGAWRDRHQISRQYAKEYYGASAPVDPDHEDKFQTFYEKELLPDTVLPAENLTLQEEHEACRALKGSMLRQEVYADDAPPGSSDEMIQRAQRPYTVAEQNFTMRMLQPQGENRHSVFFTHPRESISYHFERDPADPRIQHALTLDVDDYGNILKEAAVGYERRQSDLAEEQDRGKQTTTLITYTENLFTRCNQTGENAIDTDTDYRTPLPAEMRSYELTGFSPENGAVRFSFDEWTRNDFALPVSATEIDYEQTATANSKQRRLIEHVRTLYRPDDLGETENNDPLALLPLGKVESLALPGESYKLAFTPGLVKKIYVDSGKLSQAELDTVLADEGKYVHSEGDANWWIPSGRVFYSPGSNDASAQELAEAQTHFFLPRRYRDPFHANAAPTESFITYDDSDLLLVETRDPIGNRVTAGERDIDGAITRRTLDYRVLQPWLVSGPNRNRQADAFDALGMVIATAVMGKPEENLGDLLDGFHPDPLLTDLQEFSADPQSHAATLLGNATSRIVYDLERYKRADQPPFAATLARETHCHDPGGDQTKIQVNFSYSDGFGREIQKKIQAEAGDAPQRQAAVLLADGDVRPGDLMRDAQGKLIQGNTQRRWVGTGRTVFNNKGKPVRQYEPFFSSTHLYEPERDMTDAGVSPVLFYDPVERVVATLHPNHTYEKVVFDPWQQTTYDVNDTCAPRNQETGDPRTDPDISSYVAEYFKTQPEAWQTWHAKRIGGVLGQDERNAALRVEAHADTPTTAHFDALGRPFLTVVRNRVVCTDHDRDGKEEELSTRVELDIEGNQRAVRDAVKKAFDAQGNEIEDPLGRIVMRYDYDIAGPEENEDTQNAIHQVSMEAGERWTLLDVAGKPIRTWDNRGHNFTTTYDALRRPIEQYVRGTFSDPDPRKPNSDPRTLSDHDILVDKIEYGEPPLNATAAEEAEAQRLNLRTRIYRHFDSAGLATNARLDADGNATEAYDFKGNLLGSTRRLVSDYKSIPDWRLNPQLDAETFESSTRYDALNRPIQSIAPHSSLARAKRNVIQPVFNEANLLERVDVWLERAAEPGALLDPAADAPSPVGVDNIDYDAKGQRLRIDYKNGATTRYRYDEETFRLIQLRTVRGNKSEDDCAPIFEPRTCEDPPAICQRLGSNVCIVQDLSYTYDPAGNITHIKDDAKQIIFFRNKRVEPSNDYTYDALYRLIHATGREHLGQTNGVRNPPVAPDAFNMFHARLDHPGDGNAMGTYIERYVYDEVGNFLKMQHRGSDPAHAGWTRTYDYLELSLIEDGSDGAPLKNSNRLTRTTLNPAGNTPQPETYLHDVHGNMVRMPHLGDGQAEQNMHWDYKDQLHRTDLGGGGMAYYVYDASGQRVRKVWEKSLGLIEERIYLGGYEIFRKHGGPIGANSAKLERETLHVMDDKQRIALVETRTFDTAGDDQALRQLICYQFGNHLSSANLELDDHAQIISYEEYTSYGSTSYQAVRSKTETPKRYRYTGKERDEESGFYYHGARYYASWLGRWTRTDPKGLIDGTNSFIYVQNRPLRFMDDTGLSAKDPPGPDHPPSPTIRLNDLLKEFEGRKDIRSYQIGIYVDQPGIGKDRDFYEQHGSNVDLGHVYFQLRIELEGGDVVERYAGFYPESQLEIGMGYHESRGIWKDDSQRGFEIAIEYTNLTEKEFGKGLKYLRSLATTSPNWNVNTLNCTDIGLQLSESIGRSLPDTARTKKVYFSQLSNVSNPADLGEDLRSSANSRGAIVSVTNTEEGGKGQVVTYENGVRLRFRNDRPVQVNENLKPAKRPQRSHPTRKTGSMVPLPGLVTPYVFRGGFRRLLRTPLDVQREMQKQHRERNP